MRAGTGKYKVKAEAVKYKFETGAVKYKLRPGPEARARTGGRETQIPQKSIH